MLPTHPKHLTHQTRFAQPLGSKIKTIENVCFTWRHLQRPTESIPIRYIVASRRIMYLQNILQRDKNEMVRRVYEAQKEDPSSGDFVELVNEDCAAIKLDMTEKDIEKMPKLRFKKIVKAKVLKAAFEYLTTLQQSHSKMQNIKYKQFETASYMTSPKFSNENVSLLLALRTRTVRGIRNDFGGLYTDKTCPLGYGEIDTLPNILTCEVLKQQHTSKYLSSCDIKFEDIFSSDIMRQQQVTELYRQLLEVRNKIISSQPVDTTGPVHCT